MFLFMPHVLVGRGKIENKILNIIVVIESRISSPHFSHSNCLPFMYVFGTTSLKDKRALGYTIS